MKLTYREKWLFIMTVMKISQTGKNMPMEMKQGVSEFLRKKICPELTHKEWLEIEKDMHKFKSQVMGLMFEAMSAATSGTKLPPEAAKMFDEADLAKLDKNVKKTLQNIDFGILKNALDKLPPDAKKELGPMFENIENLTGDYFGKKKGDKSEDKST